MKNLKKSFLALTLLLSTTLLSACGNSEDTAKIEEIKYYAPLSGIETQSDIKNDPIFAVMLDNHPKARPQSGLNNADVIYEFKAEGEYTRYLALFQENHSEQIGPVRSARPYFVDTAAEYDAIYAHWGGSEAGYAEIPSAGVKDLDGIFLEGSTFYRNKEVKKFAPHNGYTSYDLLKEASENKGYLENYNLKHSLNFDTSKDLEKIQKQMGENIANDMTFDFFPSAYNMQFIYNEEDNNYSAIRSGETLIDEKDSSNVLPKNIILQYANSKITGPKLTLTISHIGEGNGKLFTNGKVIDITWEKESATSPTIFKTLEGEEIILTPGLTFVEVLDESDPVTILPIEEVKEVNDSTKDIKETK